MSVPSDSPPAAAAAPPGPRGRTPAGDDTREARTARPSRSHETTLDWFAAAERVGQRVDLDASAHAHGAMLRRRGVPSATNLLCLAFLYGPGRMPLRLIAERSSALGIAKVSEPALLRRLLNAADWLEHLADELILDQLAEASGAATPEGALRPRPASVATGMDLRAAPPAHDRKVRQVEMAKRFILDFVPWPQDLYTDMQVHWLLCIRWMFVSSTMREGASGRADAEALPPTSLDRSRTMAHLIAAVASRDAT